MNGYLSGAAEIISCSVSGLMANKFGRRNSTLLSFMVAGAAFILYEPMGAEGQAWSYGFLLVGKLGGASSFSLIYLLTTESFPTAYRGTVFGVANTTARIGGIVAPVMSGVAGNSLMYILGSLSLASGVSCFFLEEKKGKLMDERWDWASRQQ